MSKQDKIILELPPIFNLPAIISYLSREQNEISYTVVEGVSVRRLFKVGEILYLCDISYNEQHQFIRIDSCNQPYFSEEATEKIASFVMEWFDLKKDLKPFTSWQKMIAFCQEW